jgi:glycosyltransferase involved in cell wall biosynthesis
MKLSIVTPAYNSAAHISRTIDSVLSQVGNFEIEYIVVDGLSTDNTCDIVREYIRKLESKLLQISCNNISLRLISEKDNGMYDAINKGFAHATGDVFAWINSDDTYLPGAFETMTKVFGTFPDVEWAKGITNIAELDDPETPKRGTCYVYNPLWLKAGIYGVFAYFVHQDSVFWRKSLWNKVGSINKGLKYAGDYELWTNMAKHTSLWSVNTPVSVFHKRAGQLSGNMTAYRAEQANVRAKLPKLRSAQVIKLFFWSKRFVPSPLHALLYPLLFTNRNRYYIEPADPSPIKKFARTYFIS